jgi:drug/metabolite transporter (DMT)-like permease
MPLIVALIGAIFLHESYAPGRKLGLGLILSGALVLTRVLVTIVSLVLYGRAVAILGALGGAAFGTLVPALSALIAIPLLGEWPSSSDWVGIFLVSFGVYFASGGIPMEVWRAARRPSA